MILRDALVGQEVWVYVISSNGIPSLIPVPGRPPETISALVLEQDPGRATLLGWRDDQLRPVSAVAMPIITPHWASKGITLARRYGEHCECLLVEEIRCASTATIAMKKSYGNECPCGIHPTICEYHRP